MKTLSRADFYIINGWRDLHLAVEADKVFSEQTISLPWTHHVFHANRWSVCMKWMICLHETHDVNAVSPIFNSRTLMTGYGISLLLRHDILLPGGEYGIREVGGIMLEMVWDEDIRIQIYYIEKAKSSVSAFLIKNRLTFFQRIWLFDSLNAERIRIYTIFLYLILRTGYKNTKNAGINEYYSSAS